MSKPTRDKPPATFYLTYRGDIRDIASIFLWLRNQGALPKSRADLINVAVANLVNFIAKDAPECSVKEYEVALKILTDANILGGSIERVKSALANAQFTATASTEGGNFVLPSRTEALEKPKEVEGIGIAQVQKLLDIRKTKDAKQVENMRLNMVPTQKPV